MVMMPLELMFMRSKPLVLNDRVLLPPENPAVGLPAKVNDGVAALPAGIVSVPLVIVSPPETFNPPFTVVVLKLLPMLVVDDPEVLMLVVPVMLVVPPVAVRPALAVTNPENVGSFITFTVGVVVGPVTEILVPAFTAVTTPDIEISW